MPLLRPYLTFPNFVIIQTQTCILTLAMAAHAVSACNHPGLLSAVIAANGNDMSDVDNICLSKMFIKSARSALMSVMDSSMTVSVPNAYLLISRYYAGKHTNEFLTRFWLLIPSFFQILNAKLFLTPLFV